MSKSLADVKVVLSKELTREPRVSRELRDELVLVAHEGNGSKFKKLLSCVTKEQICHSFFTGGDTILHWAAPPGQEEICQLILQKNPQSIYVADNQGKIAMFFAALEVVKLFYQFDPRVIYVKDSKGNIPLHEYAYRGKSDICSFLISKMQLEDSIPVNDDRETDVVPYV